MGLKGKPNLKGINIDDIYLGMISVSKAFQITVFESYTARQEDPTAYVRKEDIYLTQEERRQVEAFFYGLLKQREQFAGCTYVIEEPVDA